MGGTIDPRLSIVSSYLNGVRIRQQRQMAEQQQLMQQQRIDEDIRQFDLQLKQAEEERAARLAYQKSQTDLEEKRYGLTKALARPQIIKGMQEGSISSEKHPIANLERFNQLMSEGNHADAYELSLRDPELQKIFGDVSAPTAESAAVAQRKLLEPKVSANVDQHQRIAQVEQPFKLEQLGVQADARMALEAARQQQIERRRVLDQQFQREMKVLDRNLQERLTASRNSTRLTAARMAREANEDPDDIAAEVEMVERGLADLTDYSQKRRSIISGAMIASGKVPVGKKKAEAIRDDISRANGVISEIEAVINKHGDRFGGILAKAGAGIEKAVGAGEFADDNNRLAATMGNLVSSFGGESGARLSNQDIDRMKALLPNYGVSKQKNLENVEKLRAIIRRTVNTKLSHIPKEQRLKIFPTADVPWIAKEDRKVAGAELVP